MAGIVRININPNLLLWAREESGYGIEEIAGKIRIPIERYLNWEKNGCNIPLGKLKEIAANYKRQLATFLLPQTPPKSKIPVDYRNRRFSEKNLSKEFKLAIRRAYKYLDLAVEIQGTNYWNDRYDWFKELDNILRSQNTTLSPSIIDWLRNKLEITPDTQSRFKSTTDAFKGWRKSIEEKLGIFIFQFPMPVKEIHGFCITEKPPYAVVVNSKHAPAGKIFTLFHELFHIFSRKSGICLPDISSSIKGFEYDCNKFAAVFLVPENLVDAIDDMDQLKTHADNLRVSREVYLRRSFELNLISKKKFFEFLKELRAFPYEQPKGGPLSPLVKSRSTRGGMFYDLMMSAVHNDSIDYNTASDALGLSINFLTNA